MHTISYEFNSLFWLVYIQMLVGMVDSDIIHITIEYQKHFFDFRLLFRLFRLFLTNVSNIISVHDWIFQMLFRLNIFDLFNFF